MTMPVLRPLGVGEILDISFGMFRRLFGTLVLIQLVCGAVPFLLNLYIEGAGGISANLVLWGLNLVLMMITVSLASVASVNVISEHYLGRALPAGAALGRATALLGPVIVVSLLTSLVVGIGLLLLLVPGVILLCGLLLSTQALVLEPGSSATGAMGRSWALTKGYRLRMFGLLVTLAALIYLPIIVFGVILGVVAAIVAPASDAAAAAGSGDSSLGVRLAATSMQWAVQMLIYPILYCVLTVAYYDLRVRKEGFDLEVLAAAVPAGQPA